jgi:hypothetical protein
VAVVASKIVAFFLAERNYVASAGEKAEFRTLTRATFYWRVDIKLLDSHVSSLPPVKLQLLAKELIEY